MFLSVVASVSPTVQALASMTPSPSPAAVAHSQSISDTINALASKVSTTDLLVAAGFVTTGVQYLINRFKNLRASLNWVISFALPFVVVALASFASGDNSLHLTPVVYLLGQFLYFVVERIKATVQLNPQPEVPGATTNF